MTRSSKFPQKHNRPDATMGLSPGHTGLDAASVQALVDERARFHRFVAARLGNAADADDLLQEGLRRALQQAPPLRRGERTIAWFYRILRNAMVDHYKKKGSENRRMDLFLADMESRGDGVATVRADWDVALCACFRGLIPALKPRYAEVIRRVDLQGEPKLEVARALNVTRATMDVLLHRARAALRERLVVFCGACTRENVSSVLREKNKLKLGPTAIDSVCAEIR